MNDAFRCTTDIDEILAAAVAGRLPSANRALQLAEHADIDALLAAASAIRNVRFGDLITYSRKVFVPLTRLCRDSCHYCTFAETPRDGKNAYLTAEEVLEIARAGKSAGCKEVLFTHGDKPELRYDVARRELASMGYATTFDYLEAMAKLVLEETGLLPHLNPGVMTLDEMRRLRQVSASMGLMLETASERLAQKGGPHFGSPDKQPAARLEAIALAGEARVPFTSGILIGIGETRLERIESLLALREINDRYGHLQEIIIQNFRAKEDTRMARAIEPSFEEHLWTIAVARIIFGNTLTIQAPPNLSAGVLGKLIEAGIDDWGGISPVTPDHVNPEAPWPELERLERESAAAGKILVERLAIYPAFQADAETWLDPAVRSKALRLSDAEGYARANAWAPGIPMAMPRGEARIPLQLRQGAFKKRLDEALDLACQGQELAEEQIVTLFQARGEDFWHVCETANELRREVCGDRVGYVVNRNITYTNLCYFKCQFCAFSKGKLSENLRGRPYDMGLDEIARRTREAVARGATEVCIQGGIHPTYTGQHYLDILQAVKNVAPDIHVHAFSPLEISQGAETLGMGVAEFLTELKQAGLGSLPGTAAEILDDPIRKIICADKLNTHQWLSVVQTAHELGIPSTATIMYGHIEQPVHWARHLLHLRWLQLQTGGFTEFVPLPFVAEETPMFRKGRARAGATLRESVLMHAVARLVLHPVIPNIQSSWVKMGKEGIALCLEAGANDFGGTLMDESISRAAGASHGQEMSSSVIEQAIRDLGRVPWQRTTLYVDVARPSTAQSDCCSGA